MLGKTAGGLFWMFRYLERSENIARLMDAGFRMALTRTAAVDEWKSVVTTAGVLGEFENSGREFSGPDVIDFLLRDKSNPSSVRNVVELARNNARLVRTAITREVWEATNECWLTLNELLARPVRERGLPEVLGTIRQQSGLVRGALHGSMLRNENYNFSRLGTFLERADNTARILNVKYYVLLPTVSHVGSSLDNVQWETILRSVAGQRAYRWLHGGVITPKTIADFLIFNSSMPRSLKFCHLKINDNLGYLAREYGSETPSLEKSATVISQFNDSSIDKIFDSGLHEFIEDFLIENSGLGAQIEQDFRFYG